MTAKLVCILTWCGDMESLYGTLLTFKTLRVGFPGARVIVTDNASTPAARPEIMRAALAAGCEYRQLDQPTSYNEYFSWAMSQPGHDDVVVADPDLVFWENMEGLKVAGLFAGRFMPAVSSGGEVTSARLHPSLIFVPSARALTERLQAVFQKAYSYYHFAPFEPAMAYIDGRLVRWDTLAQLYAAFEGEAEHFIDSTLDCYDHLFCGTHLSAMRQGAVVDVIERAHHYAQHDIEALRGIWRDQEAYFSSLNRESE